MKRAMLVSGALAIFAVTALLIPGVPTEAQSGTFKVIVHAGNPVTSLSKDDVSKMFLKKKTKWDHGPKIVPIDQLPTSQVREAFSEVVHNRSASNIKSYWQKQIFSGRGVPPQEKSSDREVIELVRGDTGAIGYVAAGATVGDGVKVVQIAG